MKKLKQLILSRFKFFAVSTVVVYALLVSLCVGYIAKNINFNYELDSFFPKGTDDLAFYLDHVKRFESDHDVILVSLTNNKGIFRRDFMAKFKKVNDSLANFDEVLQIAGPLQMARIRYQEPKPMLFPFIHPNDPGKYEKDSIRIAHTPHFVRQFISFPSSSVCFILKLDSLNITESKELVTRVKDLLDAQHFDAVRLSGRVKSQTYIVSKMQKEFIMLASVTAVMLLVFLYFTFRNFWGVVLPFLVVTIGMIFTLTSILFFSGSLNLISVILPTILFVVGVSDSVHVLNSYYTELNHGHDKFTAIRMTVFEIGRATFLTAITSAIGFFTLISVSVKPIADFGVFSAIGILVIYVVSFTFLIAMLFLLKPFYLPPQKEIIRHTPFKKLFYLVLKRKAIISIVFAAMIIPLVMGVFQIRVNNYFTEDLRSNDPHKIEFDFFDRNFGGVRPYEMSIRVAPGKNIFDVEVVRALDKFEKYIADSLHVGSLVSSNTVLRMANQMRSRGDDEAFKIVTTDSIHAQNLTLVNRFKAEFQNRLVSPDLRYGRLSGRLRDIGAIEVLKLHARLDKFYHREIDTTLFTYKPTGISEIIDGNIRYLTSNMMDGLVYELLAIGILMGLLFRSFKMMLLSLIPNIFPLLFIGGIMGWFGINLNIASSIIFSIAFGITVDDTIHLLGRYKLELKKGLDNRAALLNAYMYSGKAVMMTSVILFSGFAILMLSSFKGIFNTGLLVGLTLFVAVFSDLLLLPLLFGYVKKESNKAKVE